MSECGICGEVIGVQEPRTSRTDPFDGVSFPVHRACTKEGIERWHREGQPHSGPLEAARRESWTFTGTGPDRAISIRDVADSRSYADLFHGR